MSSPSSKHHRHKPWFDSECKEARRTVQQASRISQPHRTAAAIQVFKELTARKKRMWTDARLATLLECARNSPARFWSLYRKKGNVSKLVDKVKWFRYFKRLFAQPHSIPVDSPPLPLLPPSKRSVWAHEANQLNDAFTSLEIANAIKHMKKNKATGIDGMRSEHILDASHYLIAPLTTVFNKIFNEANF